MGNELPRCARPYAHGAVDGLPAQCRFANKSARFLTRGTVALSWQARSAVLLAMLNRLKFQLVLAIAAFVLSAAPASAQDRLCDPGNED